MNRLESRVARVERRPGAADSWRDCTFWDEQADGTWRNEFTGETVTSAELDRRPEHVILVGRQSEGEHD